MILEQFVIKWSVDHRYDLWWRNKHNIPFGSVAHREVTQLDITFEYFEQHLSNEALEQYKKDEENKRKLKETGEWSQESKLDKDKSSEIFAKIDLKDF